MAHRELGTRGVHPTLILPSSELMRSSPGDRRPSILKAFNPVSSRSAPARIRVLGDGEFGRPHPPDEALPFHGRMAGAGQSHPCTLNSCSLHLESCRRGSEVVDGVGLLDQLGRHCLVGCVALADMTRSASAHAGALSNHETKGKGREVGPDHSIAVADSATTYGRHELKRETSTTIELVYLGK